MIVMPAARLPAFQANWKERCSSCAHCSVRPWRYAGHGEGQVWLCAVGSGKPASLMRADGQRCGPQAQLWQGEVAE